MDETNQFHVSLDAAGGEGDLEMTFLDYFQIQHIETSWYLFYGRID